MKIICYNRVLPPSSIKISKMPKMLHNTFIYSYLFNYYIRCYLLYLSLSESLGITSSLHTLFNISNKYRAGFRPIYFPISAVLCPGFLWILIASVIFCRLISPVSLLFSDFSFEILVTLLSIYSFPPIILLSQSPLFVVI